MSGLFLAIDIGNTTTHIGGFDGDKLVCSFRLASTHMRTIDEAALLLRQILTGNGLTPKRITGSAISSIRTTKST